MTRRLRIGVSVFFAVLALAVAALWIRSLWRHDVIWHGNPATDYRLVHSMYGRITVLHIPNSVPASDWGYAAEPALHPRLEHSFGRQPIAANGTCLWFPHWSVAVVLAILAALPWARSLEPRFSLRTLLIALTLVAVLLGLVMWLAV